MAYGQHYHITYCHLWWEAENNFPYNSGKHTGYQWLFCYLTSFTLLTNSSMAEIISLKNHTQFAAIKLFVNLCGITWNERDCINVKCNYLSQVWYLTSIILLLLFTGIHLSS